MLSYAVKLIRCNLIYFVGFTVNELFLLKRIFKVKVRFCRYDMKSNQIKRYEMCVDLTLELYLTVLKFFIF